MIWFLLLHLALYIAEAARTGNGVCPDAFTLVGNQCLWFVTFAVGTYQDARQFCHASSGELATVSTADQFALVVDHIRGNGYGDRTFWMDGTDEAEEGNWVTSSGQPVPRGTPFWAAFHLGFQEPNNAYGNEHCLDIYASDFLYLNDASCDLEKNFICEVVVPQHRTENATLVTSGSPSPRHQPSNQPDEGSAGCPFMHVEVGGHCLMFVTWADVTWSEAASVCGDSDELLAITDANLLREVYLYLHREGISGHSLWLGGSDTANEGTWVYTTGQPVPMGTPFWGIGEYTNEDSRKQEPDGGTQENCLLMDTDSYHYFRDVPCSTTANPLCVYVG